MNEICAPGKPCAQNEVPSAGRGRERRARQRLRPCWEAVDKADQMASSPHSMAVETECAGGELLSLRWSDVNLKVAQSSLAEPRTAFPARASFLNSGSNT